MRAWAPYWRQKCGRASETVAIVEKKMKSFELKWSFKYVPIFKNKESSPVFQQEAKNSPEGDGGHADSPREADQSDLCPVCYVIIWHMNGAVCVIVSESACPSRCQSSAACVSTQSVGDWTSERQSASRETRTRGHTTSLVSMWLNQTSHYYTLFK